MFDPNQLGKKKEEQKNSKKAISMIREWAMELVPADLKEGLMLDIQEMQCGDPNCSPIDTVFTMIWTKGGSNKDGGKGRWGIPLSPEEVSHSKDILRQHFPSESSLKAWRIGELSEEEKHRREMQRAYAVRQACLDNIHHFSLWANAIAHHPKTSSVARRTCVATLKELADASNKLFSSTGMQAKEIMQQEITMAEQLLTRICSVQDLEEVMKKYSVDLDEQAPMKLWSESMTTELKSVYTCPVLSSEKKEMLRSALSYIRQVEKTYPFQQALWDDKQEASGKYGSPVDTFTYGSSSFALWSELMALAPVQKALKRSPSSSSPKRVAIFGSSHGLLSLYTDALFNSKAGPNDVRVEISGWEVLPALHDMAQDILANVESDVCNIKGYQEDMNKADVSECDVVVLTSLCWDKKTRGKVAAKLARELPPGAVVVDYRDDTFSEFGLDHTRSLYGAAGVAAVDDEEEEEEEVEVEVEEEDSSTPAVQGATEHALTAALDNALAMWFESYLTGQPSSKLLPPAPPKKRSAATSRRSGTRKTQQHSNSSSAGIATAFRVEAVVEGACSWGETQKIYVHKR
jgi:hypothetical protein